MADFNTYTIPLEYLPDNPGIRTRAHLKDPMLVIAGQHLYELLDIPSGQHGERYRVRLLGLIQPVGRRDTKTPWTWVWMQYTNPNRIDVVPT